MSAQRLDKWIANTCGLSRKEVKDFVRAGRVCVNGETVHNAGMQIDPDSDVLCLDGKAYTAKQHIYIMLHKPLGVVSASRDRTQKTVLDLVPAPLFRKGLFPAGRLDKDTSGFVLLTDDGDFAHRILSPKNHIQKTYLALISEPLPEAALETLAAGITLRDGTKLLPAEVRVCTQDRRTVQIKICEGKYHQIRRMLAAVGCPVQTLTRTHMGALALDPALQPGECRLLTETEKEKITQRSN